MSPIQRTGRPTRQTMYSPISEATAIRAIAPLITSPGVSNRRTTAPLTGVVSTSSPLRKSCTSFSIFAAECRIIMASRESRNRSGSKRAPPATTAAAAPKITGAADAERANGRIATSHFRNADVSSCESIKVPPQRVMQPAIPFNRQAIQGGCLSAAACI